MTTPRFRRLSIWLQARYGERVHKVSLRGGFTCPNRDGSLATGGCAFCAGDALEPVGYAPGQDVATQLAAGMAYIRRRHHVRRFVAYYQDYSATYAPAAALRALYAPALAAPEVVALAVGTRPDCLGAEALAVLAEVRARRDVWLELGLQLADDAVLAALGRGHDVTAFVAAARACAAQDLPVCAHVILGLPGVSAAQEAETAAFLAEHRIWGVKLHAFHVIAGSALGDRHRSTPLPLCTREEHVARVVAFLERLPPETVIHRVTGEAPRRLTLDPAWSINKLAVFDAVVAALEEADTWQGRRLGAPRPRDPQGSVGSSEPS